MYTSSPCPKYLFDTAVKITTEWGSDLESPRTTRNKLGNTSVVDCSVRVKLFDLQVSIPKNDYQVHLISIMVNYGSSL